MFAMDTLDAEGQHRKKQLPAKTFGNSGTKTTICQQRETRYLYRIYIALRLV